MASGRDRICRALEELAAAELRRLKATLNRLPVAGGYGTIPRGRMEGADALDLTDLVIGYYREEYGVKVTAEALRRIQRRDLAAGLAGEDDPPYAPPPGDLSRDLSRDPSRDPAPPSPAEAFVSRHRLALIHRTRAVAALLDGLEAEGVLTTEEVATVAATSTPQAQMRLLLATAPAWGRRGHVSFLGTLRRLHPCLLEELEGEGDTPPGD